VLEGRSIARLEMSRPKPEPVSDRDRAAGKAALTPRYLEFSLVALDAPGAEKTP